MNGSELTAIYRERSPRPTKNKFGLRKKVYREYFDTIREARANNVPLMTAIKILRETEGAFQGITDNAVWVAFNRALILAGPMEPVNAPETRPVPVAPPAVPRAFSIDIREDQRLGVDLRDLHGALESKQDFSTWSKSRLADFIEGEDFCSLHNSVERNGRGGQNRIDYAVSIDCAKHIAMLERTDRGKAVRAWFIEREKQLRAIETAGAPVKIPTTMKEALRIAMELEERNEALAAEVIEMKPKADFFDLVTASDDQVQIGVACQVLSLPYGRTKFFQKLREDGILIAFGARYNLPKQDYVDRGFFTVKENEFRDGDDQPRVRFTTHVTQKGLAWLAKRYAEPT